MGILWIHFIVEYMGGKYWEQKIFRKTNKQEVLTDLLPKHCQTKFRFVLNPTMVDDSAQDVCHKLLYHLRMSNLHFQVKDKIRKRFLKGCKGPASSSWDSFMGDLKRLEEQKSPI